MKTKTLLNRVDGRLAGYATLAGAALAAPAFAPSAEADIIYSGMVNINIPSTTGGVYLNVATGVNSTATSGAVGWDVNPWSSTNLSMFASAAVNAGVGGGVYVGSAVPNNYFNLAFGTIINGSSAFSGTGTSTFGGANPLQLNGSGNLIGFRFFNEGTGMVNFGWMRISLGGTSGAQPRTLVEFAFDNTGAGIGAGVIPEPSTLALLSVMAVGAVGVRVWRKRKAA